MSDEENETKPFKFVTGKPPFPLLQIAARTAS
jgi:hypothetical protein